MVFTQSMLKLSQASYLEFSLLYMVAEERHSVNFNPETHFWVQPTSGVLTVITRDKTPEGKQ